MSDQIFYNKPTGQSNPNNNMILWVVLAVVVATILLFAVFGSNANNESINMPTSSPQPTQIPQEPQETQIPQDPQATQIPQEPQSTQVPETTTIPTPTVEL